MSDPAVPLVNNPELLRLACRPPTHRRQVDRRHHGSRSPPRFRTEATPQRTAAIRDAAIVVRRVPAGAAARHPGGAVAGPAAAHAARQRAARWRTTTWPASSNRSARGGDPGPVEPIPVHTTEEVGQVAHAVDELHEQAVFLAGEQARLQLQVSDMFETLSRRSRSLVDQQLSLIDRLERNEEDPDRLESLFRLDHLAARMRRNGANLLVLAGAKVPREQADPVPVAAIINAAASEVEDYTRVVTATVPDSEIVGVGRRRPGAPAGRTARQRAAVLAADLAGAGVGGAHRQRRRSSSRSSDIGLGMTESDLRVANTRLQSGGEVNPYTARHMGLFVVGRLAASTDWWSGCAAPLRANRIRAPPPGVYVPAELLVGAGGPDQYGGQRLRHARRCPCRHRDGAGPRRGPRATTPATSSSRPGVPQRSLRVAGHVAAATRSGRQRDLRHPGVVGDAAGRAADEWPARTVAGRLDAGADARAGGARRRVGRAPQRPDRHVGVLRVARPGREQRCADPQPPTSPSTQATRGRARAVPHAVHAPSPTAGGRRHLPEDAVRVAGRSAPSWPTAPTWTGSRCGTTAGRRPPRPRTRPSRSTPRTACRCASPAPGWCPVRRAAGRRPTADITATAGAQERRRDDEVASAAEFDTGGAGDSAAGSRRRPRQHQQPFRRRARRPVARPRDQRNRQRMTDPPLRRSAIRSTGWSPSSPARSPGCRTRCWCPPTGC